MISMTVTYHLWVLTDISLFIHMTVCMEHRYKPFYEPSKQNTCLYDTSICYTHTNVKGNVFYTSHNILKSYKLSCIVTPYIQFKSEDLIQSALEWSRYILINHMNVILLILSHLEHVSKCIMQGSIITCVNSNET